MTSLFDTMFKRRPALIGMLHVWPGELKSQVDQALDDARRLTGFDGLIVENYDWGYKDNNRATEDTALTLGRILQTVARHVSIPVGVNILPNDYEKALFITCEFGGQFVQLDHVTGEFTNAESVDPDHFLAVRDRYPAAVLGGVQPKYYRLRVLEPISAAAQRAMRLADAIVVTGTRTGSTTKLNDLQAVRQAIGDSPLLVGSGLNANNARRQLAIADGGIVGTALKDKGVRQGEAVNPHRAKVLLNAVRSIS